MIGCLRRLMLFCLVLVGLAAGLVYAVVAVSVVARGNEKANKSSEIATLAGSLVVDAACCTMLLWFFAPIEGLMRSVGG